MACKGPVVGKRGRSQPGFGGQIGRGGPTRAVMKTTGRCSRRNLSDSEGPRETTKRGMLRA